MAQLAKKAGPGTTPPSFTTAIKRRAFTLAEISVVILILMIFAALAMPDLVRRGQQISARNFVPSVRELIQYARAQAIGQQAVTLLQLDDSGQNLTVSIDNSVDANTPASSETPGTATTTTPQGQKNGQHQAMGTDTPTPSASKSVSIPSGIDLAQFQLAGKDVASSDWKMRFYPDGTSDGGLVDIRNGQSEESISIDSKGQISITPGSPPDPSTVIWQAGQIAQRPITTTTAPAAGP